MMKMHAADQGHPKVQKKAKSGEKQVILNKL
jgi:hypothetical protein